MTDEQKKYVLKLYSEELGVKPGVEYHVAVNDESIGLRRSIILRHGKEQKYWNPLWERDFKLLQGTPFWEDMVAIRAIGYSEVTEQPQSQIKDEPQSKGQRSPREKGGG